MRDAIRQQLITQVVDVAGRVFEPHAAGADTPKPYLVLRQGMDTEDTPWTGFRRVVEVWPYVPRTTFKSVDGLADTVVAALNGQLLTDAGTGEVFTCVYLGTAGPDFVDEEWDALTRGLRFAVLALQAMAVQEAVANDPWLEALATWTSSTVGSGWTVYRNAWPLGYKRPAVLWRLVTVGIEEKARAMFEVRKKLTGHIIGATPNQELSTVLSIVEGLGSAIKVPLDLATRRYLTVVAPTADFRMDALTSGQISVTLSRLTARPTQDAPLMMKVYSRGQWR